MPTRLLPFALAVLLGGCEAPKVGEKPALRLEPMTIQAVRVEKPPASTMAAYFRFTLEFMTISG